MRTTAVLPILAAVFGTVPLTFSAVTSGWTSLGPDGGQVQALAIDPQNSNTLYAATNNGISKSTDGAKTWIAANLGLPTFSVNRLVIDPQNTSTLYASTVNGIFKSTDSAANWNPMNSGLPTYANGKYIFINALAISPQEPSTLYVGMCCDAQGVFKTIDGGATWNAMALGLSGGTTTKLGFAGRTQSAVI